MRASNAHSASCSCSCSVPAPARVPTAGKQLCHGLKYQLRSVRRAHTSSIRAGPDDRDDSTEKLFSRELQKRGISSTDDLDNASDSSQSKTSPPQLTRSQLEESRKLNSEGLEGLIPRAKQLITLGGTFFLAFVPFILVVSLAFSGLYWAFGDNFIHGGRPSFQRYIDPMELLNEPTVDERIPF